MFGLDEPTQCFAATIVNFVFAVPLKLIAFAISTVAVVIMFTDTETPRMGNKMAQVKVTKTDS